MLRGRELVARIAAEQPDIVCLTETDLMLLSGSGYAIASEPDYGYGMNPRKRKVVLWSKEPWDEVTSVSPLEMPPGRIVQGVTETSIGRIRVIGICVPWREAHVRTGRCDRAPWQDHTAYLTALSKLLQPMEDESMLVVGDLNQRVPRKAVPQDVHRLVEDALLRKFQIATAGPIPPIQRQSIDHVLYSGDLGATSTRSLDDRSTSGAKLSDHFGVVVELSRAAACAIM